MNCLFALIPMVNQHVSRSISSLLKPRQKPHAANAKASYKHPMLKKRLLKASQAGKNPAQSQPSKQIQSNQSITSSDLSIATTDV
jgi:hypothetical protein